MVVEEEEVVEVEEEGMEVVGCRRRIRSLPVGGEGDK